MTATPIRTAALAAALLATLTTAHANVSYTFDTDAQGFSNVGDGLLEHITEAANGFLKITDTNGSTDVFLNVPLGAASVDWSAYLGGTLSFDGIMLNGIAPSWPDFGTIRFTDINNQVVLADLASPNEPGATWKTYTATLDSATFANQGGASLASVLANLASVTLSAEAGNGPVEIVGIDNFRVMAVPEPSTWALMLAGLAGMAWATRRRT
jgi:PEP-CTERM motif